MRLVAMLLVVALIGASISVQQALSQDKVDHKYVGTKTCGTCHKTEKQGKQLDIWKSSKHAEAFTTLTSEKANAIAKEKGLKKPASESPECLSCHVAGNGADAKLFEKTFDAKEGVQCEACHGAGSGYKAMAIMKDKAKAIAAGLHEYKDQAAIETFCKTCHNEKSPTFKEFKFADAWAKIKHEVPKK